MTGHSASDRDQLLWESLVALSKHYLWAADEDQVVTELAHSLKTTLGFPQLALYSVETRREPPVALVRKAIGDYPIVSEVPIDGDRILAEVLSKTEPLIVEDARTDPRTNKEVVRAKGCRTLVFLPMRLADGSRLFISTGTFGEKNWSPDPASLEYLATVGYHTGLALDRLRMAHEQDFLTAETGHAEKMELLGRMAGSGAHELRNLLTAISGYTALVADLVEPESEAACQWPKIERAAANANRVLKNLLAFSRREACDGSTLDLNAALSQLRSMLSSLLGEQVELELDLDPELKPVAISRHRFEQLVVHLVANASDALGDRGHIVLSTRNGKRRFPYESHENWVHLSVSDDGPGLLPEVAGKVFDPYFSTRAPSLHPGLGLSTCYGIVHQADGQIAIETGPGKGTIVRVRFPSAAEVRTSDPPLSAPGESNGQLRPATFEPRRALVEFSRALLGAEDVQEIVKATRELLLKHLGFHAVYLYLAREIPPQVVELWAGLGSVRVVPKSVDVDQGQLLRPLLSQEGPVLIEDVRLDPRVSTEFVEKTEARTLICLPFRLADQRPGLLVTGSYGDQGVRPVSEAELEFISALTALTVAGLDRCQLLKNQRTVRRRFLRAQHLEAVSRLGRGLADDVRNALTGIDGFTHLSQVSLPPDHPAQAPLAKIELHSRNAAMLVNKMVALTGIEKTSQSVFDLNQMLHSLRPMLGHLFKDTRLEFHTCSEACLVKADWGQMEQVVMNLLHNAHEALERQGEIQICTELDGEDVALTVKDNGHGMSREVASLAFEPFFTTKPEGLGTGLGLPTCQRVLSQAGGSIELMSEPGRGTEALVRLPLHRKQPRDLHHKNTNPQPELDKPTV